MLVLHHLFLGRLLLTQVAAVVVVKAAARAAQAALAAVAQEVQLLLEQQAQPIPAAVVVERVGSQPYIQAEQAAPASSSLNTKSPAQPRSSPSSHRRSGKHLLVRSALTTLL